ncbi:hypothetical protein GCM10009798_06190 [Nocardioides panacihumi]|uniref:Uncharacterized protein n=1 Tax=Nocardioides panacihumi TaxID=400774 RepID=A0ABN2QCR4_9ACTN
MGQLDGHSESHETVHADRTWLSHLPSADTGTDIELVRLNAENTTGHQMRRVDFMDPTQQVVSLCFAASKEAVLTACPGSTFLDLGSRDGMDLNAVSEVGGTAVNWLGAFDEPSPVSSRSTKLRSAQNAADPVGGSLSRERACVAGATTLSGTIRP